MFKDIFLGKRFGPLELENGACWLVVSLTCVFLGITVYVSICGSTHRYR